MTEDCQNCGESVTDSYARVKSYPGETAPRACPFCPDKVYGRGGVREARTQRNNSEDRRVGRTVVW